MTNPNGFIEKLKNYDFSQVNEKMVKDVKKAAGGTFSYDEIKSKSLACASMGLYINNWIEAAESHLEMNKLS